MSLLIKTYPVSHFEQNARILVDTTTNDAIIIDPGADVDQLFEASQDYTVTTIFITHCHIDHAGGVMALQHLFDNQKRTKPQVMYHSNEIIVGQHIEHFAQQYGLPEKFYQNPPQPDQTCDNLDFITVGSKKLQLLFTPGHAPGHISLYYDQADFDLQQNYTDKHDCSHLLIAGDTLFSGSIGRTDLPLANHDQLIDSIQTKLFTLPDDTLVCPGHGPNTTIGTEKATNPFLQG